VEECGVPDHGNHRLPEAEAVQLAQAAGHAHTCAHAVNALEKVVPGTHQPEGVAAYVTEHDGIPAIQLHRGFNGPEGGPVRAPGTQRQLTAWHTANQLPGLPDIGKSRGRIGSAENFAQAAGHYIRVQLTGIGTSRSAHISGVFAVKPDLAYLFPVFGCQGHYPVLKEGVHLLGKNHLFGLLQVFE